MKSSVTGRTALAILLAGISVGTFGCTNGRSCSNGSCSAPSYSSQNYATPSYGGSETNQPYYGPAGGSGTR